MDIELEKRISKIDDFGIFTKNAIPDDTEFYKIPLDIIYSEPKPKCARIADGKYVSDDKVLNWVNHSCSPNSRLDINCDDPALIAIRDILPNEEITVDYNQTEIQGVKIKCTCKSENCKEYFNRL
jgi:hypothetical protein